MRTLLSLLGLYEADQTIFDDFVLPSGIDKTTAQNKILADTAELEILFANPVTLRSLIGIWSATNAYRWKTLYDTTTITYDPRTTYTRSESWTDNSTDTGGTTDVSAGSSSASATSNSSGTSLEQVAGFDGASLADRSKTTNNDNANNSSTAQSSSNKTSNRDLSHQGSRNGNVTEQNLNTQDLIEKQRKVGNFGIYDIIVRDFIHYFCLEVY